MKNIFYCVSEREFYYVEFTKKLIKIDWINNGGLDLCVTFDMPLILHKEKNKKHCLKYWCETEILCYPLQAGIPFFLKKAKIEDVKLRMENCQTWGISIKYYQEILKELMCGN